MRIGLVCPYSFDEPGGVQAHILDLADSLIERGHFVRVLGPARTKRDPNTGTHPLSPLPDYVVPGGTAIPIRYNGSVARISVGPQVTRRVRNFIEEGDFDVLHIHEPNSPSFSFVAAKEARGPIVATYHASITQSRALDLVLPLWRTVLENIRAGIAVSETARRWQVEKLGTDPVLIPNGVDTRKYRRARLAVGGSHGPGGSSSGVDERPFVIAFLGRLDEPRKGLDVLVRALRYVEHPIHLKVMGAGTPRSEVAALPHVTADWMGRVADEEKARVLAEADVYVAPNLGGESFGIVLVEAMAAGCPVLASDLESFSLVCDADSDTPAGRLFRTGEPQSLAEELEYLISHPEIRRELSTRGLARSTIFDWETVTDQVMAVYESVTEGRPGDRVTVRHR